MLGTHNLDDLKKKKGFRDLGKGVVAVELYNGDQQYYQLSGNGKYYPWAYTAVLK